MLIWEIFKHQMERRLPYGMYDYYPITAEVNTSSTGENNLQDALDKLVNYKVGSYSWGVKRYRGIKQASLWAQNFTRNIPTDDVPFYHTIQVSAQNQLVNGTLDYPIYRFPTRNETFVQANLAMCYGAKGIMYFLIMTATRVPLHNYTGRSFYGLFEWHEHFGA